MYEMQVVEQRRVLGKDFKIYGDFENPLFKANDVAKWIENANVSQMLNAVDENEKALYTIYRVDGSTNKQWFLTEDGLYEVLMQSRKPIAKAFKKEVKAILKEIRKTGRYGTTPLKDVISLIRITRDAMERQGATPTQVAETIDGICKQYGINLPNFVIKPETLTIKDAYDMIDFIYSQPVRRGYKKPTFEDFIAYKSSIKMLEE